MRPKKILMLVENLYPQDVRIVNEAELLTEAGRRVFVVSLKEEGQKFRETINGVEVYRVPTLELFKKTPNENPSKLALLWLRLKSLVGYVVEYCYFTTACFLIACWVFIKRGFDAIHAHNPPDTLFLAALPFRIIGKKFVFDHHDLSPELYQSRYSAGKGLQTRVLAFFEWCSLKLANITIATNESYKEIHVDRGGKHPDSVFIVRNGPNVNRMNPPAPCQRLREMGKTILCYVGALNPQDGVDYLLRSLKILIEDLGRDDFHCVIMGGGDSLEDLRKLSKDLRIEGNVELPGYVPEEVLLANLSAADICVDPDPSSPLNDVSTWIKIMEYMAFSKPIVSFDLKETMFSAQDAALFVPANDEGAFAGALAKLMDDPEARERMGTFGRKRVEEKLQWAVAGKNLVTAYNTLFGGAEAKVAHLRGRSRAS